MFILGTANFGQKYNGSELNKKECFKVLEEYKKLGGVYIDTAFNYGKAQDIIGEFGADQFKINTKVWSINEFNISLETLKIDKLYSCMARDINTIDDLKYIRMNKQIEKWGVTIYYPHELRGDANITFIPFIDYFLKYLPVMLLHGDVWIRSFWNIGYRSYAWNDFLDKNRNDIGHNIYMVCGVSDIYQLRNNMEFFNAQ